MITAQQKYDRSEKGLARHKEYYEKNKTKANAKSKALCRFPKARKCSIKGCKTIAERHHPNYNKPLLIIWLCREHHLAIHGKVRKKCKICGKPAHARKLCDNHYMVWFRKQHK